MIASLLIANRGEIACRVIRTARLLAIRTVAVYSDADTDALHVRLADDAVHIGPSAARESYLCGDKIIAAAKASGAEAIHPGYGFLSENADFAQAVIDAGLVWVGPKPDSIRAMGLKDAAKKLMAEAGVPVTPGYLGEDQDPKRLKKEADAIGYPVLIKAVAGGGGKGMRRVDDAKGFDDALESAKREAASSFGDDRVLIEKYITSPRHIEVQVFGDSHGNVVHLFERDCSLQRRHQKVIEEAPAPGMDSETRAAVCGAAVRAAQAVKYEGAGTIEFIADASQGLKPDRIWFMEMNTRLQVEHPVTEEITGQDLVEWQLRVASGEPLPMSQDELTIDGHAVEARLYAEDPAKGFLPSVGKLEHFDLGEEGRIETGVEEGDTISPFYDPMIAKLIYHSEDRKGAINGLADILDAVEVWPVKTNAAFLVNAITNQDFWNGQVDTGFIGAHLEDLIPDERPGPHQWRTAAFWAAGGDQPAPFAGFRLNGPNRAVVTLSNHGETRTINLSEPDWITDSTAYNSDEHVLLFYSGLAQEFSKRIDGAVGGAGGSSGTITAPMPGKVTAVEVSQGEKVGKGQRLLTLEAMKMEHSLIAPFEGIVIELNAKAGAQVSEGIVLARVQPEESK
jgi:3-methylcrotonyl-CoA carboxylase alpha subunit